MWSITLTVENGVMNPGSPEFVVKLPPDFISWQWDISSDDKRFLALAPVVDEADSQRPSATTTVDIIFNFFTELNEKAPLSGE